MANANSVLRIDPKRNAVADVVPLGRRGEGPEAVAVHGHRVWVYSEDGDTVSSFDERTKHVQRTGVPVRPVDVSSYAGPVLAADAGGAWLIGVNWNRHPGVWFGSPRRIVRTSIRSTGARGVAVGYGAVWVVAHGDRDSQLLRIDPATGRITHRTRFPGPAAIDSVATGLGYVWVVGAPARRSTASTLAPASGAARCRWTPVAPARPVRPGAGRHPTRGSKHVLGANAGFRPLLVPKSRRGRAMGRESACLQLVLGD